MKKLTTLAALVAAAFAGSAMADFTGIFAPGNFTVANVGTLIGGSPILGSASFAPTSLSMTGSDAISLDPANFVSACVGGSYANVISPCQLQVTINASGSFSFDWDYATSDGDGPPGDIFGVLVDGNRVALSDPGGGAGQSGNNSFSASSSFGWFINCTDCIGGSATVRVANFSLVPEPSSFALLVAGVIGLGASARRRKSAPR